MTAPERKVSPEMLEYRGTLERLEQDAQVDYDKALLALSGGALGISFAFFRDISQRLNTVHAGALLWAWIFWGLSVAISFISLFTAVRAFRKAIKQVDEHERLRHFGGWYDRLTTISNALGGILFLLGLGFAIYFLYSNLH